MKKLLFTSIAFALLSTIVVAQPAISFTKTMHDFGVISEQGGKAICEFSFTNSGKSPLVINKVTASCGCTTPDWTKIPIAPGKKGVIKAAYNPKGRPGSFQKSITVYSNIEGEVKVLTIKGTVTKAEDGPQNNQELILQSVK